MFKLLAKLLALSVLVAQVSAAFASVWVLCVPVMDCDTHETAPLSGCGSDVAHIENVALSRCGEHEHRPSAAAAHSDEPPCTCYVHVPAPGSGEQQGIGVKSRGEHLDEQALSPPTLVIACVEWVLPPSRHVFAHVSLSVHSSDDRALSLRSTRLLI